jgi:hypothetical protein
MASGLRLTRARAQAHPTLPTNIERSSWRPFRSDLSAGTVAALAVVLRHLEGVCF